MKKSMWIVKILTLIIISCLLFTACQNDGETSTSETTSESKTSESKTSEAGTSEEINIRFAWWGGEERAEATTQMVELFMEQNPQYNIECEPGSWDTFWQKLSTQISSGDVPDVCQTDYQFTGDILRMGKPFVNVDDLGDIIDTSEWVEINQIYMGEEGYTYGVPLAINVRGTFYSVPFFEKWGLDPEADWTFEKLIEEAKRIHTEDPDSYMMHLHTDFLGYLFNESIKARTGSNVFDDETYSITASTDDFVEFFKFFEELVDSGALTSAETMATYGGSSVEQVPGWQNGDYGMFGSFISNLPTKIAGTPFDIGTLRYLYLKDSVDFANTMLPATLASISVDSPYVNECAEFVNWFVNDDDAIMIHKTVRGYPANKRAAQMLSEEGLISQHLMDTISNAEKYNGTPASQLESNNQIKDIYLEYMSMVAYDVITPEEAAENCMQDLNNVLGELKS